MEEILQITELSAQVANDAMQSVVQLIQNAIFQLKYFKAKLNIYYFPMRNNQLTFQNNVMNLKKNQKTYLKSFSPS